RRRLFRRRASARRLRRHGRAGPQRVMESRHVFRSFPRKRESSPKTGSTLSQGRAEGNSSPSHLAKLNDAAVVRERCGIAPRCVADGHSPHFTLDESRLAAVSPSLGRVTREAYPDLKI